MRGLAAIWFFYTHGCVFLYLSCEPNFPVLHAAALPADQFLALMTWGCFFFFFLNKKSKRFQLKQSKRKEIKPKLLRDENNRCSPFLRGTCAGLGLGRRLRATDVCVLFMIVVIFKLWCFRDDLCNC